MALRFGLKCAVAAAAVATAAALTIIDVSTDPRQDIDITGTEYPAGLRLLGLGAKNVTLRDVTVGCPGLHVSGGQDAAGHLALINVTATCNDVPSNSAVVFMNGGNLRGTVLLDSCTVTAPNATQQGSDLLQIRRAAGRLAIRGGRYTLNSVLPAHRCIDLRNVQGTADITVENVEASVAVSAWVPAFVGTVAAALRVDRMLAGGSVSITNSRFVTEIPTEAAAFGVEVESAAAGSKVALHGVTAKVHGRASLRAFGVLSSSCAVTVDGGRFLANASWGAAYAVRFENYDGAATLTSTSMSAVAARSNGATALSMTTVGGQVTVVDSTLAATASNQDGRAVYSSSLSGVSAALAIRGCTMTAASLYYAAAVSLRGHRDGSAVSISNSSLTVAPDAAVGVNRPNSSDALFVTRFFGSATVDVSDSRLVARGHSRVSAAYVTLGSTGAAVSIVRSTLDAMTITGSYGVVFGYTTTLKLADCAVTARSAEEEAAGVFMYDRLSGSLTVQRTAFTVSAAKGPSVSGGIIAVASVSTEMDGMHLTLADSTFDDSASVAPLLFVRLPQSWAGASSVAITNVTMTEKFNSTERGLVSTGTRGVYVTPGSSATRCLTGLVLGGVAVADNFALPGVPSTVDCATPAPTAAPTRVPAPSPETPVPVPFDALVTINATALAGDVIDITGTAYPAGLRLLGLGAKNMTLRDVTVGCPGLHVSGGQDAAGHLALVNVTATCNDAPTNSAVVFMNGGNLFGGVVIDSCTVTAPNATQQGSDLLQIRKAAGRLAIRGGRFTLNSVLPAHRCIDFRNVQGTAVVTVENVEASVAVPASVRHFFGTVAAALRVDRMLAGGSVAITNSRLVSEIPLEVSAFAVEVESAAAGSKVALRGVAAEVHGQSLLRAFSVLWSSCAVTVDGGRFVANASRSSAYAVRFNNYGGPATLTSASMTAVAASSNGAAALSMTTVGGQVTVVDSTLSATAGHEFGRAVSTSRLSGARAALAIRGCTMTASAPYFAAAVSLQEHRDGSAVTISNSTLMVGPDAAVGVKWLNSPDALFVQRISGSATVDISDSRLVARGNSGVTGAYVTLGSTGAAVSIVRSTLDAMTITGDGASGVVFGYTSTTLVLRDCTVTARSAEDEAIGVNMFEVLSGNLTVQRTAFTVSAAKGPAVSGGIIAAASHFTEMDGLRLTVADSTFDGSSSAVSLLFVRLPHRWAGQSRVAITNVTMTEQFNSTERGLVSMAGNGRVSIAQGSSATRCLTGLVLGGVAVADNFALPGVPSTVDCATPAPTAAPVTPAPVPVAPTAASSAATSNSDTGATPSPALTSAPVASSSVGGTPAPTVPSPSASSQQSSAAVPATPQPTPAPGPSPSPTFAPTAAATSAPPSAPASSPAPTASPLAPVPAPQPTIAPGPSPAPAAAPTAATPAPTPAPVSPASTTPAPAPSPTTPSPVAPVTPVPATRPAGTPAPTPAPSSAVPHPSHTPVPSSSNGHRGGGGHAAASTPDSTPALSTAATVSIAVVAGVAVIVAVIAVAAFLVIRRASRVSPVTTAPDDHRHNNGPFSGQSATSDSVANTEQEMDRVDVFPAPGAVTDADHNDPFGKLQYLASPAVVLGQVAQP